MEQLTYILRGAPSTPFPLPFASALGDADDDGGGGGWREGLRTELSAAESGRMRPW